MRTRKVGMRCWEMNWKRIGGFDNGEGSGWDYGRGPNGCSGDIDRQGTGSDNAPDNGRNDMPGDNMGEWMEEGLGSCPQSTRTLLVEGRVLRQIPGGRKRLRCWRTRCEWIRR